jgi:hypothetical protein
MNALRKLSILAIVLLAILAAGWWLLRSGDPTAFAKGKRVELADFQRRNPTSVPRASQARIWLRAANI